MQHTDSFSRVTQNFIIPLGKIFSKTLNDELMAAFVEDLGKYSAEVLVEGATICRRNSNFFPRINQAIDACEEAIAQHREPPKAKPLDYRQPWEKRDARIREMIDEYLEQFTRASTIWSESKTEGWDFSLLTYVRSVAYVQAQMMIPGGNGTGWDSARIFGTPVVTDEDRNAFMGACRRQAETGFIDVAIPVGHIAEWKAVADQVRQKANTRPTKPNADSGLSPADQPKPRTPLDDEIDRQLGMQRPAIAKGLETTLSEGVRP